MEYRIFLQTFLAPLWRHWCDHDSKRAHHMHAEQPPLPPQHHNTCVQKPTNLPAAPPSTTPHHPIEENLPGVRTNTCFSNLPLAKDLRISTSITLYLSGNVPQKYNLGYETVCRGERARAKFSAAFRGIVVGGGCQVVRQKGWL